MHSIKRAHWISLILFLLLWGDPLTASLAAVSKVPPLKESFSGVFHSRYHGIWGDGKEKTDDEKPNPNYTWKNFKPLLNAKNQYRIFDVDYTSLNANSFNDPNITHILETTLKKARKTLRSLGLAGDQVDIVAHSMGGLVVRAYCQDNVDACKQTIRKLKVTAKSDV